MMKVNDYKPYSNVKEIEYIKSVCNKKLDFIEERLENDKDVISEDVKFIVNESIETCRFSINNTRSLDPEEFYSDLIQSFNYVEKILDNAIVTLMICKEKDMSKNEEVITDPNVVELVYHQYAGINIDGDVIVINGVKYYINLRESILKKV